MITGADLIAAGLRPGKWFRYALAAANGVMDEGGTIEQAILAAVRSVPATITLPLAAPGTKPFHVNIVAENEAEEANVASVKATMTEIMRTPVVRAGAIMPDSMPAGPLGTIPVGGVVASEAIHPGMHSPDICCSMALTVMLGATPAEVLDAIHKVTHFGPGARQDRVPLPDWLAEALQGNLLLISKRDIAESNFATQGDGNHFAYVGTLRSTGETVLVTHHGSRGPGAALYKDGMKIAERYRQALSPATLRQNAWIPFDTDDGREYWEALQILRLWTRASHYALHDMAAERVDALVGRRHFNEHNFVFRKPDGLFYHAKGATPAFGRWSQEPTLIPLNMAEPILIVRGKDAPNGLGFSPHGAGRNLTRTAHKRLKAEEYGADARGISPRDMERIFAAETAGLDVRFYMGEADISELPSAYKNAAAVRAQIEQFGLAEVIDEVLPYGSIMAGDWERNMPWRKKREGKK